MFYHTWNTVWENFQTWLHRWRGEMAAVLYRHKLGHADIGVIILLLANSFVLYIVCYSSVIFWLFIQFSDKISVSWLVDKIKIMRHLCALKCPIECPCRHEYWNFYFDLERVTLGKNNDYCYYVSLWPISKNAIIGKQLCELGIMLFTMTDNVSNMPWSYRLSSDLEQHLLW